MNIFMHRGIVDIFAAVALIVVTFGVLMRLNIIQRRRGKNFGWLAGQGRGGVEYWRGRVFGVGEQSRAGFDVEKSGGVQRGVSGKPASLEGGVKGLAGHAKGGGAFGSAAVGGNQLGNQGFLHGGGLHRARLRLEIKGCHLKTVLVRQFLDDETIKGQSVFSMHR